MSLIKGDTVRLTGNLLVCRSSRDSSSIKYAKRMGFSWVTRVGTVLHVTRRGDVLVNWEGMRTHEKLPAQALIKI